MNVRLEEAERDGLVGEENANERERQIQNTQIQNTQGKNTNYKIQNTKEEGVEKNRKQRWRRWGEVEIL